VLIPSLLHLSWQVPLSVFVILLALYVRSLWIIAESCLVVQGVGVHFTTHFASGRSSSRFIDINSIKQAVINEGVGAWRIITYVALVRRVLGNDLTAERQLNLELPFRYFLPSDPRVHRDLYHRLNELLEEAT
jgi:hypothetical protein